MERFKGTKEKWHQAINVHDVGDFIITEMDKGYVICKMIDQNETAKANAKLIVKAPELVKALQYLTQNINLSKLNIKKDFELINAHANATKIIHEILD